MKVKLFRAPRLLLASLAQARAILSGFWFLLCARKFLWLVLFAAVMTLGFLIMRVDAKWLDQLHFWTDAQDATARQISRFLSKWGNYPVYNVTLAVLLWLFGVCSKSSKWRRIAIACLIASSLAGLIDDSIRMTLGRPRPDTNLPDHFYGFTNPFHGTYQSFPSGHAATTFATAMALLVLDLPLGIITTLFAFAVIWARMELYRHYPSDIIVGAAIGIYFGLMTGFGTKLRRTVGQFGKSCTKNPSS